MLGPLEAVARRYDTRCGDGTLVLRRWGPEHGRPLVLFHGGSGSWRHWVKNISPLSATRPVLCVDLPGLGDSAMPPDSRDPAAIASVLRAGIAEVLGEATRFDLCGFSFGALMASHVAAQSGTALASVTLVGATSFGLPHPRIHLESIRERTGADRMAAHRQNLEALMFADPSRIDALALEVQEANTVRARLRSRGWAHTTSSLDAIATVRAPVALLYGERDAIAWPETEARFARMRTVQPDAWCGMVPGAGHWVAYEAADAFNAMLLDLLDRRRSK